MQQEDILNFWFEEIDDSKWWTKDPAFDQTIRERFSEIHQEAKQSALFSWRNSAEGRLAEIIVLDQFSRNMFRDKPEAFAQDPLALALSQEAVRLGLHKSMDSAKNLFLVMPYMHSESLAVHNEALQVFEDLKRPGNLEFEHKHRNIIARFGRYPHRNKILGRTNTAEEEEFLKQPGSSF